MLFNSKGSARGKFGFCLSLLLTASTLRAGGWDELPVDKAAHFGLSSVAVEASMKTCQAWEGADSISFRCRASASALVLSAGILKEVSDQHRGRTFDKQDLVADMLGVLTGNLLQWTF